MTTKNQNYQYRQTKMMNKFFHYIMQYQRLSCEPLLSDLGELDLSGIDWVIVGGESGINARAMQESWVLHIKKQCEEQKVAFFFKQWGTWGSDGIKRNKKENGALLGNKLYREYPKFTISNSSKIESSTRDKETLFI